MTIAVDMDLIANPPTPPTEHTSFIRADGKVFRVLKVHYRSRGGAWRVTYFDPDHEHVANGKTRIGGERGLQITKGERNVWREWVR